MKETPEATARSIIVTATFCTGESENNCKISSFQAAHSETFFSKRILPKVHSVCNVYRGRFQRSFPRNRRFRMQCWNGMCFFSIPTRAHNVQRMSFGSRRRRFIDLHRHKKCLLLVTICYHSVRRLIIQSYIQKLSSSGSSNSSSSDSNSSSSGSRSSNREKNVNWYREISEVIGIDDLLLSPDRTKLVYSSRNLTGYFTRGTNRYSVTRSSLKKYLSSTHGEDNQPHGDWKNALSIKLGTSRGAL